jgi:hypothetical protein
MSVATQALTGSNTNGSWPPTLLAMSQITNQMNVIGSSRHRDFGGWSEPRASARDSHPKRADAVGGTIGSSPKSGCDGLPAGPRSSSDGNGVRTT